MELDVYFGGSSKKYIVNKYTKRFILALDVVKHILGSENNFEVLKVDRKGKLYNVVVMTDHDPLPAVLEISQVEGGVNFMARRSEACGFSPMVVGGDYSSAPKGVLTLILKECDKQGIDGENPIIAPPPRPAIKGIGPVSHPACQSHSSQNSSKLTELLSPEPNMSL